MQDKARKVTDKELAEMEKHIDKLYKDAYADLSKEWNDYMFSHKAALNSAFFDLVDAKKSGDAEAIKKAQEKYDRTVKNITVNNARFQGMSAEVAAKISHVNEVALDYVNGNMPKIYTTNYNALADTPINGYSFSIVNENAIRNLAIADKAFLPVKTIDIPKDIAWNQKLINSQMFQGILLGENVNKLADRLQNVTDMDKTSAIRNARTMTTAAENKGRQDSFEKAQRDGVKMYREWVATFDDRTRAWHADLHGVRTNLNQPWENDYGKIMYPGDPTAHPANVYNCRCSMISHVNGFAWNDEPNIPEFDAAEDVERDLGLMDLVERAEWINIINHTNYAIMQNHDLYEAAQYLPDENKVILFQDSSANAFWHETSHSIDDYCLDGQMVIQHLDKDGNIVRQQRLAIGSASGAADEIYNMDPNAWDKDDASLLKWAGMKDDNDTEALLKALDQFKEEHGELAQGFLFDLIDGHSNDKYTDLLPGIAHASDYFQSDYTLVSKEAWAEITQLKAINRDDIIDLAEEVLPQRVNAELQVYNVVFSSEPDYVQKLVEQDGDDTIETIWIFKKRLLR